MRYFFVFFLVCQFLRNVSGYDNGDRVSATIQTLHSGWKTVATDLPLTHMPYFGKDSASLTLNTPLPQPDADNPRSMTVNPDEDVKIQLAFGNALLVPWIAVFDSKKRRNLESLVLTFYTDRYNIVRVVHETRYSTSAKKLDPKHPSVTGFNIKYVWRGLEDEDTPHGLYVMFISTVLLGTLLVLILNWSTNEAGSDDIRNRKGTAGNASKRQ